NGFNLPSPKGDSLDFRTLFGLAPDTAIIGCAGRFSPQKGLDLLPDLLSRLPDNIHVVHAGDGEYEQEITAAIKKRPESARIHFLVYQQDMDQFYSGIDLSLLRARNKGMANVLYEAMSHGKPVVSTRVPGTE